MRQCYYDLKFVKIRDYGPQGYIVLLGPIKLMVPIGMGLVDIKYHTGGKYIAFVHWVVSSCGDIL